MSIAAIHSFPPIAEPNARVLILGSMPGEASLQAGQYYAHPRNHFWPIVCQLFAWKRIDDYAARCTLLHLKQIALWDVLQSCQRQGSLDSSIQKTSQVPNDFKHFLNAHPAIDHICFNGGTAATIFKRQVLPTVLDRQVTLHALPSTSPAHARLSFAQKLQAWQLLTRLLTPENPKL